MTNWADELKQLGGCGLILSILTILGIGVLIYLLLFGGNPDAVRVRNNCVDQKTRALGASYFSDLSEQAQFKVVRECEAVFERYLQTSKGQ